jgi:hypothetical protein
MSLDLFRGLQAQQGVEDPRVGDVDLRPLDLPLADVLVPGLQDVHDEGPGQAVDLGAHRGVGDPQRPTQHGEVEHLTVVVGQHRPEAPHGDARDAHGELGQFALYEGAR